MKKMAHTQQRIYIDTNVLYNWLFGASTKTHKPATDFIQDIKDGKYVGVISDITLNELCKIIRHLLVKAGKNDPVVWKRKQDEAIRKIYSIKMEQIDIVSGTSKDTQRSSSELEFGNISSEAYNIMEKYPGKIISSHGQNKHKGLSTVDSLHVILAKVFNCSKIASFDGDFHETHSEIPEMIISEDYKI